MGIDERDIRDGRDIGAERAGSGYVLYLSLHNADACRAKGDYKEERKCYETVLKYDPSRTDLHEKIAVTYESQGKMQDAAEYRAKNIGR